jgi:hypothetical protein
MAVKNDGFVMTLDSDSEDVQELKESRQAGEGGLHLDANFTFDIAGDSYVNLGGEGDYSDDLVRKGSKPVRQLVSYSVMKGLPSHTSL